MLISPSRRVNRILRSCNPKCYYSTSSQYKEVKRKVLDVDINVLETVGNTQNAPPVFFLPGAFGSIEMDFKPIIAKLNLQKYKWFCYDPPGYGKSRPPNREFCSKYGSVNVFDIQYIRELMKMFGYSSYTLLAWSGAAISAINIASEEPKKVSGLITWGAFGFVSQEMIPGMQMLKELGLSTIPDARRAELIAMYGEDLLLEMWKGWCDEAQAMTKSDFKPNGPYLQTIRKVQCPTLLIHGMKDKLVVYPQVEYLNKNIKNSRIHIMEDGTHNIHLRKTEEFMRCIEDFVDSTTGNGT